jgi:glycosyltransferase involved in cell wall biosynthesis
MPGVSDTGRRSVAVAQPPRVLYVGTLPPHQGGSSIQAARLLRGLSRMRWSVRAIAPIAAQRAAEDDPFAIANPEIAVTRFSVPHDDTNPYDASDSSYRELQTASIRREVTAALARAPADIILIGRESFAWGIRPIARAHGALTAQLLQGLILAIAQGSYRSPELGARLVAEIRGSDLVIAVADHAAATARAIGIDRCISIPNAVDTTEFRPRARNTSLLQRLGLDHDCLVVMHASNLKAVKRPLDIVESAQRGLSELPALRYLIVGDGPERQAMEEACRSRGIADRFRFVGWVEHSAMPAYYGIADVVVMPSTTECFALAYLETQASGRVLLASDVPAAREAVENGHTGLLFPVGDVADLSAKTLLLARDAQLRARIGRNARTASQARELSQSVGIYARALQDLIIERRRPVTLSAARALRMSAKFTASGARAARTPPGASPAARPLKRP